MDRVPPEVLEKVFAYLNISKDVLSVSRTSPFWKLVVDPNRSNWMFGLAFPFLLKYLSKRQILQCRAVSRFWRHGVDYFLQNNHVHRPGLEVLKLDGTPNDKIEAYHGSLLQALQKKDLLHSHFDFETEGRLLINLLYHKLPSVSPFILTSVMIQENDFVHPVNETFLEMLGSNVIFIKIVAEDLTAQQFLANILDLLQHLPNLKRLEMHVDLDAGVEPLDAQIDFTDFTAQIQGELTDSVPKLESLVMNISGPCVYYLEDIIMQMFCTKNLLSLEMDNVTDLEDLDTSNLADLKLDIFHNDQLKDLLNVDAPIRNLHLNTDKDISAALIFKVVSHFKATLQNVYIQFDPPDFYAAESLLMPSENLTARMLPFMDTKSLEGVSNVKSLEISGVRPAAVISLNFLMGLKHSQLEHLTLQLGDINHRTEFLNATMPRRSQSREVLDLIKCLRMREFDKLAMYRSNVWSVFPKLKVLTVLRNRKRNVRGDEEADEVKCIRWSYRRDDAEKVRCQGPNEEGGGSNEEGLACGETLNEETSGKDSDTGKCCDSTDCLYC